ncbi:MAG: cytochrome c [Gammaproteobacteria bacterium]|nr:cytochrome c [Gammaproteobacteria bacterium]MDH3508985.1 cytochrome c [Gammaproteobacteria bacterium]
MAAALGACAAPTAGLAPTGAEAEIASAEPVPPVARTLSSGLFTSSQASRGERRFQQLCADCHRTVEITRSWFSGTVHHSAGDLMTVMSTTMPETSPGSLSPDQYADILAFLLRLNNYPAGEEELPADPAVLTNVPIPAP